MSAPLLEVARLEAAYGTTKVLFDVGFSVAPGEFVTLLGRNGMGRSTTIAAIMGFVPPIGGEIRFAGAAITGLPSHVIARAGIGLVPEGRRVFPTLTVYENLAAFSRQGTRPGPWSLERVYGLFPRLKERAGQLAATLSGGEQQMLAIGRALVTNPRLLILDEATEGLAPLVSREIWTALGALKGEGLSAVVTDKNLKSLLALADRHYVMAKGRTVWGGSTAEFETRRPELQAHLGL